VDSALVTFHLDKQPEDFIYNLIACTCVHLVHLRSVATVCFTGDTGARNLPLW